MNILKRISMAWILLMLIVVIVVYIQASQLEGYITIACISIWTVITWWQHKNRDKIFEQRVWKIKEEQKKQLLKFKEEQEKQQTERELYIQQLEKDIQDLHKNQNEIFEQRVLKFKEEQEEQQTKRELYIQQLEKDIQDLQLLEKSLSDIADRMSGEVYERYVGYKLIRMGWKSVEYTAVTKDYGADIIAEDLEGKTVCIQCKRYSDPVGISAVQEVYAAKGYYGCSGAMVVTTSTFTKAAHELADRNSVELLENFR